MTINMNDLVRGGTVCLAKAGLAIGGTTTKVKIVAPNGAGVDFAINGILYHKADADDVFTFTAATQAASTTCLYLACLDSSGTATVIKGAEVSTAGLLAGTVQLHWPTPTVNTCPIGAVRVASGAGVFTAGTTALTGGTVTVAYHDLFSVPAAPLAS